MTLLESPPIRRRRLAALALAVVLAVLAAATSAPAGSAAPQATASPSGARLGAIAAFDGGAADRGRKVPAATSGNLLLSKGVFAPLADVPGAGRTAHVAINNRGQTVGTYDDGSGPPFHGFLRDKRGRFTRFDVPGASSTLPLGINDHGHVVGFYVDSGRPNGVGGSFLREPDGDIRRIDVPDAFVTQAHGINNRGQIVGFYADAGGALHGFVLSNGAFRTIDVPGARGSGGLDINDRGEITGGYADAHGRTHGFRLREGVFTTIDPPGAVDVRARRVLRQRRLSASATAARSLASTPTPKGCTPICSTTRSTRPSIRRPGQAPPPRTSMIAARSSSPVPGDSSSSSGLLAGSNDVPLRATGESPGRLQSTDLKVLKVVFKRAIDARVADTRFVLDQLSASSRSAASSWTGAASPQSGSRARGASRSPPTSTTAAGSSASIASR